MKRSKGIADSVLLVFGFFLLISIGCGGCLKIPLPLSVCEAQGAGLQSPYLGREVVLQGLVIADLSGIEPGVLVLLDENCPQKVVASRGIFVEIREGQNKVSVGDEIRVRGFIREIAGETRLDVDLEDLEILSLGNVLPAALNVEDFLVPPFKVGYENWEGQLVTFPQANLLSDQDDPGRFRILPRIVPGSGVELVCFQTDSITLGIDQDLLDSEKFSIQSGVQLEDVVGLIREDQHGYYLQLVEKPQLRFVVGDQQVGEVDPAVPGNSSETPSDSRKASATVPIDMLVQTPTGTPLPSNTPLPPSDPTGLPSPTYYPIQLLISEVLPNPSGDEPGGEWIELYNPAEGWLLLSGIKIGDEISPDGNEGLLSFPDGYYLEGGHTLVIANQARLFKSHYGFLPDFELENTDPRVPDLHPYYRWGRNIVKLSNTGDEILLLDPWDRVLDLVVYGKSGLGGFSPPADAPKEGCSLERYPPDLDQGLASDWREQSDPSPGEVDHSKPTLQTTQPLPVSASATLNPGTGSPHVTLSQTPSAVPRDTSTPEVISTGFPHPAGSFTPCTTFTTTPDNPPDPTPGRTEASTPSMTEINPSQVSPSQQVLTPSATSTEQNTPSLSTTPGESATPSLGATISVTPGPMILINEILVDPDPLLGDSNGDGLVSTDDDEFLELVNISRQPLDLSSWQIHDGIKLRFTVPAGTILSPDCALVLFGGGAPSGGFGGSLVFITGSLGLNNTGDLIRVLNGDGQEVARISYGPEGNQDQSLNRSPDLSSYLPLVLHGDVPGSGGTLFSPGTRVDGSLFGACP